MTFNRRAALAYLKASSFYWGRWEVTRRWIRDMVRIEPTVMRKVAKMTFGSMGSWLERGAKNVDVCGCLVGSCAIALVEVRNSFRPHLLLSGGAVMERTTGENEGDWVEPAEVIAELVRKEFREYMEEAATLAGMAANSVAEYLREDLDDGDEEGVALIKSEILLQIKARSRRLQAAKQRKGSTC